MKISIFILCLCLIGWQIPGFALANIEAQENQTVSDARFESMDQTQLQRVLNELSRSLDQLRRKVDHLEDHIDNLEGDVRELKRKR
ncbi:MAG: hypothetical protein A3J52_02365 [Omnitrophica bacterium RIFCSPHIGHO2_02_FULL_49_9]|nr:MAG: hypothetical protein A3J52_02365 [Omnitrophica bacterium RIFCSPHIGHO2_02_FULL_49_9]OGW90018.1 MAG: hypothetical protein A3A73_00070 [Omnitrophica bacterium RIFCSPLOWO2_01_FULL_50_24]